MVERLARLRDGARIEVGEGKDRMIVPADVEDLASLLENEPAATLVAGATDVGLWVTKQMRDISPALFIGGLEGLRTVEEEDGVLTIGAGVTYSQAARVL
jgi:xanthine dehydrogenase small subunit